MVLRLLRLNFLAIALFLANYCWAQVIWEEDFSGYPVSKTTEGKNDNTTNPAADWTSNARDCDGGGSIQNKVWVGSDHWGTRNNGTFLVNDIEGLTCCGNGGFSDNEIISELIDVSGAPLHRFSLEYRSVGSDGFEPCTGVCDNFEDPVTTQISINGGSFVNICSEGKICDFDKRTFVLASEEFIQANTIQFKIITGNKNNSEELEIDNIKVEVVSPFSINNATACAGQDVVLSVSGGNPGVNYQYQWDAANKVGENGNSATYNFASLGQKTVNVNVVVGGCSFPLSTTVVVNNAINVTLDGPDEICAGDTVTYTLSGPDAASSAISWSINNGARIDAANKNPNRYSFINAGSEVISAQVSKGSCAIGLSKTVDIKNPQLNVSASSLISCGNIVSLTASGGNAGAEYVWSTKADFSDTLKTPSSDMVDVTPNGVQRFYAKLIEDGCEDTTSIVISTLKANIPDTLFICEAGNFQIQSEAFPTGTTYRWATDPGFTNVIANTSSITVSLSERDSIFYLEVKNGPCSDVAFTRFLWIEDSLPDQDLVICQAGNSVSLRGNANGFADSFVWSDNPSFTPVLSLDSFLTVRPVQPKTYYLKTSFPNCDRISTVNVKPFIPPQLPYLFVCPNTSVQLGPNNPGDFSNGTFSWSFSPFIQTGQLSQAQPTTLPLDTSTVFSLTYSEGGCSKTVQQSVAVEYMGQMLQHKNPMLVCEPDKGEKLIAYTNGIGVSYKWSTNPGFNPLLNSNASDSIITYFPNNVYSEIYLEVSSINGCVYNEQLVVSALTALPGITSKDTVCLGDTVLLKVDASFLAIPPDVVYWEPSSKMDSIPAQGDSINYFANEVGTVSAHFYFQGGCVRSISKYIQFSPIHYHYPEIINTKSSLFPDEPFSLIVQNPDPKIKYQWIPAGLDQNDSLAEQSYRSNDSLKQVQLLLDDGLCTRSVYFSLKQEELKCAEPFVPNAFSPNGDLENDVLFVRGKNLEAVSLSIYDRWGQEVFSTQNQQLGWNGTFEDKPLHPGIYVYSLKARCVSGELFTKSGNITLLR